MFSSSSIVNVCEKSSTSGRDDNNEYEYSLSSSPDALDMVSTSSFTYESMATMATSSTPPLTHDNNVSSMSPDDLPMVTSFTGHRGVPTTHTIIEETIIRTQGVLGKSDDENSDEDNVSSVSSCNRYNQLTGESKSTTSYYSVDSYDGKINYHPEKENNIPVTRSAFAFDERNDHLFLPLMDDLLPTDVPVQHVDLQASETMLYHPEIRLPQVNLWEENWLFKKKRKSKNLNNYFTFTSLDLTSESVRMFIPNPSQTVQACIGDVPIELLDDLSEKHSPAASLIFSDDDEDDQLEEVTQVDKCVEAPAHCSSKTKVSPSVDKQRSIILPDTTMTQGPSRDTDKQSAIASSADASLVAPTVNTKHVKSCQVTPKYTPVSVSPRVRSVENITSRPIHQINSDCSVKMNTSEVPPFVPLAKRMECARSDPSFLTKPCDASVQPNILIQFCCMIKGSKGSNVAWFKGDTLLKDDDDFRIFSSGNQFGLEIKETKVEHSDKYSCVVYNKYGEQWSDFKLDVKPRSPSTPCRKEGVHFGCSRGKASGIKGSSVDTKKNKGQVPNVITQTWAERAQNEKNELDTAITPTQKVHSERKLNDRLSTFTRSRSDEVQSPNRVKKQKESSCGAIASKDVTRDRSRDRVTPDTPITRVTQVTEETTVLKVNDTPVSSINETCKSVTTSPVGRKVNSLSKYKRDYYVPNAKVQDEDEEALNGVDEKVYHSSKVFISNNDNDSDTPDAAMTFSLTTSDSGAESVWSRKASSQEDGLAPTDVDDFTPDDMSTRRTPSVAKLIRQFSRCDTDSLYPSPTFTSTDSIYNDCDGKGIIPRTRSSNSCNSQQVSSSKSYHALSNIDSSWPQCVGSTYSRNGERASNKEATSASPTTSAITSSASNEGYNSDDSAIGSNIAKDAPRKQSVHLLPINKASRCITPRASFWQMRCENGLVSDSNVNDTFPSVESAYD